ncbi:MAG: transcription termination factor Rho [Lachnospiraceae bacterium]|nr:transcription termination factor Rho [Lachnospiraceae bacterium]
MKEKYESLSLATLKDLAKARGLKGTSSMRKTRLIEVMLEQDEKDKAAKEKEESAKNPDETAKEKEESAKNSEEAVKVKEESVKNQGEMAGSSKRTVNNRKITGKTEEKSGQQHRRRVSDGTRSSYEYNNGERRVRERTRVRTEPGEGTENRRSSLEQSSLPENRRVNAEQNSVSDSRRNNEESTAVSENHRDNVEQGNSMMRSASTEIRSAESRTAETRTSDSDRPPAELSQLDSGQSVRGILEVMQDGYGFIRSDNYLPGENDVYVSPSQIRRFNLKTGDIISGNTRIRSQQEKFSALLYLKKINDMPPSEAMRRCNFEEMTPIFPNERLRLERDPRATAMRIVDLFSPIGKGQRGMIVSPPKAGKTTLLKDIARSILKNSPDMRLLILLIDERPEEVTDIKEAICGENVEVIYSTFDELPEHHKRVSEMVIERAKRLVEQKQDVTILLDSITRLARAYNLTVPPSGRTLSGGLDPAALHMPKRFFGAARNMREGGSLTILATALVDTGSKMDDVVYEEFKGTGNMELVLDRKLSERRVFPAIDIPKSGTRREDLLLDRDEQDAMYIMRRALNGMKSDEAVENILNMFIHTRDNRELVLRVKRQKFI